MVERSIDADRILDTLDRLAVERGAPAFVRFDNGPEFMAWAIADGSHFNGVSSVSSRGCRTSAWSVSSALGVRRSVVK